VELWEGDGKARAVRFREGGKVKKADKRFQKVLEVTTFLDG